MMILKESGVDFEAINYFIDPIPKKKLKELLGKMKLSAKNILRSKEPIYKKLKLAGCDLSDDELIRPDGEASGSDSAAHCGEGNEGDTGASGEDPRDSLKGMRKNRESFRQSFHLRCS
jgi:intein/homing endonuclease